MWAQWRDAEMACQGRKGWKRWDVTLHSPLNITKGKRNMFVTRVPPGLGSLCVGVDPHLKYLG